VNPGADSKVKRVSPFFVKSGQKEKSNKKTGG
jgi:hypothetical protein